MLISGADPGFQVRGRTLKNCAERREARTFLGYFGGSAPVFDAKKKHKNKINKQKKQRKHPVSKCLTFHSSHGHLFLLLKYNIVQLQFHLKGYLNVTPLCDVLRSSHTETKKKGGIT
jgi:hypothetical protein